MHITDSTEDTIAALATGNAPAGVAVIRLSGRNALDIAGKLARLPHPMPPRTALFRKIRRPNTGEVLDEAVVLFFQGPHSFTGEDVVEIQCHGGLSQTSAILEAVHEAGARAAGPGEFSRRAFLNGRLSLERAEAIADLVSAETDAALSAARNQLFGRLGEAVKALSDELLNLRAEVEALLDFPEDLEMLDVPLGDFVLRAREAAEKCAALRATHRAGRAVREGVRVALCGAPNAGKSSLFNALLGERRALIDEAPGTTRDAIEARIDLLGIPCTLVDTAGMRTEGAGRVEAQGIERSREEMARSALTLWVIDPENPVLPDKTSESKAGGKILLAANKSDLCLTPPVPLSVSARTGDNLDALRRAIAEALTGKTSAGAQGEVVVTNRRHAELLEEAESALRRAAENAESAPLEIFSCDIAEALSALGRITGKGADDALLDAIFSRFCIGK